MPNEIETTGCLNKKLDYLIEVYCENIHSYGNRSIQVLLGMLHSMPSFREKFLMTEIESIIKIVFLYVLYITLVSWDESRSAAIKIGHIPICPILIAANHRRQTDWIHTYGIISIKINYQILMYPYLYMNLHNEI